MVFQYVNRLLLIKLEDKELSGLDFLWYIFTFYFKTMISTPYSIAPSCGERISVLDNIMRTLTCTLNSLIILLFANQLGAAVTLPNILAAPWHQQTPMPFQNSDAAPQQLLGTML